MGDLSNIVPFLILFGVVLLARYLKDRAAQGKVHHGTKESTNVSAETQSPATPVIIYANPIDKYITEHYPNAMR